MSVCLSCIFTLKAKKVNFFPEQITIKFWPRNLIKKCWKFEGWNFFIENVLLRKKPKTKKMEKSASFHDYGGCRKNASSSVYLGIEPLLQRAATTGDAQLLLTLLQVRSIVRSVVRDEFNLSTN